MQGCPPQPPGALLGTVPGTEGNFFSETAISTAQTGTQKCPSDSLAQPKGKFLSSHFIKPSEYKKEVQTSTGDIYLISSKPA